MMDWENIIGYVCMIGIACLAVLFVWLFLVGVCIVADFLGVY